MIYVASNDGMLHGIRTSDGKEMLAYIPGQLFTSDVGSGLHNLTEPGYAHRYYNDLTPTLSDIYAPELNNAAGGWHTILINGLRGGGRGIYALDVNDPDNFSEDNAEELVLWEFTSEDDADLGYTFSQPQIAYTNDGRWVAIFGNGYNAEGSGQAVLYIVDIVQGADGSWTDGNSKEVIKLETGVGAPDNRNGLSTPRLADIDGNGTVDRVYAGDLLGNMWVIDMSGDTPSIPNNAPLFKDFLARPITSAPALAKHPSMSHHQGDSNAPNLMVMFGSGQYLTPDDNRDTTLNHFYGVWDRGATGRHIGHLVKQTHLPGFVVPGIDGDAGEPVRVLSDNEVNYANSTNRQYGWYFELDVPGERAITVPVVRGGIVFFTTYVPSDDNDSPCSTGGKSYLFAVRVLNGGPAADSQLDTNGDGIVDQLDRVSNNHNDHAVMAARRSEGLAPSPVFVEDIAYIGPKPTKVRKLRDIPTGRLSWQELLQ